MTIRSLAFGWVWCDCVYLDPKRMSKTNLVQFYSNLLYSLAQSVTYAHTLAKQIFHFRRWSSLGHFLILSFRVYFLLCLRCVFFLAKIFAQPQKLNQNSTKIKYKINCSIFSVANVFRLKKNRMNELKSLAHNGFEKWDKNVRNKQSKVEKSVSFSCWCCYCGRFLCIHTQRRASFRWQKNWIWNSEFVSHKIVYNQAIRWMWQASTMDMLDV